MAHSLWSGSLSFGLVNIPVRMVSAVVDRSLHFHMLHDKDGGRIQEKRVCSKDGQEVPWDHIVKGYDLSKTKTVEITTEELDQLTPAKSKAISLERFVPLEQINPVYFQHPYYLLPDEGAESSYALMREVIAQSNRVGIARMVMRGKEYLVALRAVDRALSLSMLWFADEVVEPGKLEGLPKATKVPDKQLALAKQIVESLSEDFKPDQYKDEHRTRVLALIQKKAKGEKLATPAEDHTPESNVVDLMSALKASLAAADKPQRASASTKATTQKKSSVRRKAG